MNPESESTEATAAATPAPPAGETPANTATTPKPAIKVSVVALLVVGLVGFTAYYGFPVNLYLLGACIPILVGSDDRIAGKSWAKALRAFFKPMAAALALLAVFASVLKCFKPSGTTTVINWEERLVLHLHQWLDKHPSWWEYTLLLAAATLVSWRLPKWKPVQRLERAKSWLGAFGLLIAVLANLTFLGEQTVVKGRYKELNYDLWLRYRNAKHRTIDKENHALAARAVTQALSSADDQTRSDLHMYITRMAELNLGDDYEGFLGRQAMDRMLKEQGRTAGLQPRDIEGAVRLHSDPIDPADPINRATTDEEELALVEKAAAEADAAKNENSDAQEGLRRMVETLAGAASGKVLDYAISSAGKKYFDSYVDRLSKAIGDNFDPLLEALQDKLKDEANDRVQEQENRAIDEAMKSIDWKSIPHGGTDEVTAAIKAEAIDIAQAKRSEAIEAMGYVAKDAPNESDPDEINDLRQQANDAANEAKEADGVLGRFAPASAAPASASAASENADWAETLEKANSAVDRAQSTEEKAQEDNDRAAEREGARR